jgi:hypothetical protein
VIYTITEYDNVAFSDAGKITALSRQAGHFTSHLPGMSSLYILFFFRRLDRQ